MMGVDDSKCERFWDVVREIEGLERFLEVKRGINQLRDARWMGHSTLLYCVCTVSPCFPFHSIR